MVWIAIPTYRTREPVPGEEPVGYGAHRMSREEAAQVLASDPRCRAATTAEIGEAVVLQELAEETKQETK